MYEFVLADYIISSLILVIGVSILVLFLGTVTAWTVTTYNFKGKKVEVILVGVKDHIFKQFEEFKVIPNTLAEEKAYNSVRAGLKYLKFQLEEKK